MVAGDAEDGGHGGLTAFAGAARDPVESGDVGGRGGVGVVHVNLLGREPVSGRFESPRRRLRVKARVSDPESGVGLDARLRGLGCGGNRRERSAARQALAGGGVFHLASWRKVGDVARRSKLE